MYLLRGNLPWQGTEEDSKSAKCKAILKQKVCMPRDALCINVPRELIEFLVYSESLLFEEDPDYNVLRRFMKEALVRHGYHSCRAFDWSLQNCKKNHSVEDEAPNESLRDDVRKVTRRKPRVNCNATFDQCLKKAIDV
eukprot:TRINITY_DN21293_c0_g1_i1.p1 TRINITY_DN21293_c0_g1~~TRINITY_DN21293_c0_g1_i1.p1  ORF type:complete len:138 (+),score=18.03 TRINITY_DN21293_c0_g1_i1:679-1092(+)